MSAEKLLVHRYLVSGALVSAVALFSCTTEPCGCTPALYRLVATGTVSSPDQTPVANAKVDFGEQPSEPCAPTADVDEDLAAIYGSVITDAAGTFVMDLYSTLGEQCLIVTAIAGSDTARVWRAVEFQTEEPVPDTLLLTLTLGED
jgi:hypothetical protein